MHSKTTLNPYWTQLEIDLADTSGIIVPKGEDEAAYFDEIRSDIKMHATTADLVAATVVEPGFKNRDIGSKISGYLLARNDGYWLIYVPEENEYYCFWGTASDNLGAHGVYGNPLYCWWA